MKKAFTFVILFFSLLFLTVSNIVPFLSVLGTEMGIEPTTVGSTSEIRGIEFPYNSKVFRVAGRFWVWYTNGSFQYRTSINGVSWSSSTIIGDCYPESDNYANVWTNGTHIAYVRTRLYDMFFRMGKANSDGTITWATAEQMVHDGDSSAYYLKTMVAFDSNGFPWIAGLHWNTSQASSNVPYVIKCDWKNGSWHTASGFPKNLTNWEEGYDSIAMQPLTNGKMYFAYGSTDVKLHGRLWDGSSLGSEETISSDYTLASHRHWSMTNKSDEIHLVYLKAYGPRYVRYRWRNSTGSWSSEETIYDAGDSGMAPVISVNTTDNSLLVFWINCPTSNHVYYIKCVDGTWDSEPTDWFSDSDGILSEDSNSIISAARKSVDGYIPVIYLAGSSPYSVKFSLYPAFPTAPQYSNVGVSTTVAGQDCTFSVKWTDAANMSGYIFGTNNTGTWQNDTWTAWSPVGTPKWSNVTKTLNSGDWDYITYQFWANNTNNLWNTTGLRYIIRNRQYYLRKDKPLHGQPQGGAYDLGSMNKTAPTVDGSLFCSDWVQWFFDHDGENETYALIKNIYFHVWYKVDAGSVPQIGYQYPGAYSCDLDEYFTPTSRTVINGYNLSAELWSGLSLKVDNMYDFTIKIVDLSDHPYALLNTGQQSFVIFNLDDNSTLQSIDTDNDGLSDYDELFTYYTDPRDTDTDDGGISDYDEVQLGLNPLDGTDDNIAPTIGEFQAPSTVYANQYFYLNCTINDADGKGQLVNATVEISNSIILKWDNSTNTFTEYQDTNDYCTLDSSNSIKTDVNTTAYKLSFKIKLSWSYPEGSVDIIAANTKVFDSIGASGSGSQTGLFTFEDDLIVYSANVDDNHVNPSQSITVTGTIYYNGTTTPPEDTSGITAKVELDGAVKGFTSTISSDGSFSITFNAESSVNSYNYNVYAFTDQPSVQNQTVNVIVDKMVITITANTTSPLPEAYVNFTVTAKYAYDDQPVTDWTVNILRDDVHFTTGTTFTDGGYTETLHTYKVENASENLYGLTAFESEPLSVYWSYYVALTVQVKDLDGEVMPDATVYFNDEPIQVDQYGLATKTQIAVNSLVAVKVKWHGVWVNGTWTVNMTETKTITVFCNVWTLTVLAKDNKGNMLTTSPTEFHITLPNGTYMSVARTDGVYTFKVMNGTSHFRVKFQDQWVTANLTVPMTDKNVTVMDIDCWVYSLTVYVQSTANSYQPNSPIVGASLTLYRTTDNKTLNGLYGLPATPQTQTYNSTHAVYTWSQLANQTSSYTVTATYGSQSSSTTTSLTQNTQIEIELYVSAPAHYFPPAPIPTTYTLTILVTKLDQPAANLKIEIYTDNLQVASGQTDPQGKYTVNLTPGTYKIIIHLNGETKTETVNLTEPKTLQITIPAAPTPTIERFLRMSVILIIVMVGMVIVPKIVQKR
ncbi:hypothetical protein DRO59_00205 [Candidatus Bathyarchaeota archaeon]|nr:MAG: hypothetical protein DRO59_00205 [Candidatus Bathyarchaeota archaeon]